MAKYIFKEYVVFHALCPTSFHHRHFLNVLHAFEICDSFKSLGGPGGSNYYKDNTLKLFLHQGKEKCFDIFMIFKFL